MHPFFSEMQALERESANLMHKATRMMQSPKRREALKRQMKQFEDRLAALRVVVLQKQAAESTPAIFRKSYAFEMFIQTLSESRRTKHAI
jgi:7-keto-8-aminopelargonate synthetase-like enzyme